MTRSHDVMGHHLLADLDGIHPARLRALDGQRRVLHQALEETGHTILDCTSHEFAGGGFTMVFLLAESHLSVHTYPERGYLAFDLFTCGAHDPRRVLAALVENLRPESCQERVVRRMSRVAVAL